MAAHRPLRPSRPSRPPLPVPGNPLVTPTDTHPRWRLRVFDRCWPWRASRSEALRDAVASRNACYDRIDRVTYLDAAAEIQRDPPDHLSQLRYRRRREATASDDRGETACDA